MTIMERVFLAALVVGASSSYAQVLPSDTDLKAAYCVGVENSALKDGGDANSMNAAIDSLPDSVVDRNRMKKEAAEKNFEMGRPRRYLKPRMPYLDTAGVTLAIRSGESDGEKFGGIFDACWKACWGNTKAPANGPTCVADCTGVSLPGRRIKSCHDLSWLPY